MEKKLLTTREVAQELRCSKAHVINLINGKVKAKKVLPAIRIGRVIIVRRETLERWKSEVESVTMWPPETGAASA